MRRIDEALSGVAERRARPSIATGTSPLESSARW
jgi:hypothetical protein